MTIDLITLSSKRKVEKSWPHGAHQLVEPSPVALARALASVTGDAVLCLHESLPTPDIALLHELLAGPGDVWHGGLRLGVDRGFELLDHVNPQWTLGLSAPPDIESTSWRLSLRSALIRRDVIEQLGGADPSMETLAGAGLELGYRWIKAGALMRHVPDLVTEADRIRNAPEMSLVDQVRTIAGHHGRIWAGWALQRGLLTRSVPIRDSARTVRTIRGATSLSSTYYERAVSPPPEVDERTVSVILPTIDRYPYLETLLHQLADQTIPPHEVLIVDQTPRSSRRRDLESIEPDLPVTVFELDAPGQSSARNIALAQASGDLLLFLDDDDEIQPDHIEKHRRLLSDGIDAICGAVDDATAGPPPLGFRHRRASDVFPTNNTLLRREVLKFSGCFDPVFDHGPRADRDLGIRLHLGGAFIVYDPRIMVFHHHASIGGLRTHGARKVTRAGSRRSLTQRNLSTVTESYIGHRHFTARQRREQRLIRTASGLVGSGAFWQRLGRAVIQVALLPDTLRQSRRREQEGRRLAAAPLMIPRMPMRTDREEP